jgi:hypothetical protein
MYALPADAPLTMKWKQAMKYAANFEGHGHPKDTFRVPTQSELIVLFESRARIGGFNESGAYPAGWYWSSKGNGADFAWQSFEDGEQGWSRKDNVLSFQRSWPSCVIWMLPT